MRLPPPRRYFFAEHFFSLRFRPRPLSFLSLLEQSERTTPDSCGSLSVDYLTYCRRMRRIVPIALAIVLGCSVASPTSAASTFKNCSAMRKVYPGGVAKSKAAAKKSGAKYAPAVYAANAKMDRDKDGAACES